jgi:LmbE family N-acetylglucosaminyl deacetylase
MRAPHHPLVKKHRPSPTVSQTQATVNDGIAAAHRWGHLRRAKESVDRRIMTSVLPPLARRWSHDVTSDLTVGRLLVLAPHPDDETLGCGATVIRTLLSGGDALVVCATDGRSFPAVGDPKVMGATRRGELAAATEVLGVNPEQVRILDFPDGELSRHEDSLAASLATLVRSWQPTTVLVSAVCDPHPDHAALGRAARRAMAGQAGALFEYMVWGWVNPTRWLLGTRSFRNGGAARVSRAVTVRTEGMLATKRDALCCHRSQFGLSAPMSELSAGDGSQSQFLANFFGEFEIFFPVNAEGRDHAGFQGRSQSRLIAGPMDRR